MNLFSERGRRPRPSRFFVWSAACGLALLAAFAASAAFAADVTSFYVGSCKRHAGIVLNVGRMSATLLRLDGSVIDIPRYEIIYMATYPLDVVPIRRNSDPAKSPPIRVQTRQADGRLVDLVEGWPVDFTEDRISFLSTNGSSQVIDRDTIWTLEPRAAPGPLEFTGARAKGVGSYEFVHPYSFANCAREAARADKPLDVFPQQILSDPVAIKRELDRLMRGHEQVEAYLRRQQFYAVPQLYGNESSLGFWFMTGSRYGASENRANNFAPVVEDQRSLGPFSYQQIVRTGAAPAPYSIHEETQTQAYYRFKADYFHMSAMVDPGLFLVGSKYRWQESDLKGNDFGAFESALVEFGFDYGAFALNVTAVGAAQVASRAAGRFGETTLNLPRIGALFQSYRTSVDVQIGSGNDKDHSLRFWRINGSWRFNPRFSAQGSVIQKDYRHDPSVQEPFAFAATSRAFAAYARWKLDKRVTAIGFLALEQVERSFGATSASASDPANFPKAGLGASLAF